MQIGSNKEISFLSCVYGNSEKGIVLEDARNEPKNIPPDRLRMQHCGRVPGHMAGRETCRNGGPPWLYPLESTRVCAKRRQATHDAQPVFFVHGAWREEQNRHSERQTNRSPHRR